VEQNPEDEVASRASALFRAVVSARSFGSCDGWRPGGRGVALFSQRQEGSGVRDGVPLHGRNKALKGKPHERIWYEIRPAGSGRIKAPGG
jgi:hypothetical protein